LQFDSKFNVGFESIGFKIIENPMVPVNIAKTPGIMKKLEKFLAGGTSSLSPSALNTYLDCRLKFYFSRIADLREPEDVTEDIEAREMGTLFHETMHQLYAPFVGRTVARDDIRELLAGDKITQALEKAFRIIFSQTTDNPVEFIPEGKNIIIFEVIKKYAAKILELDMKKTPFQLLVLENPFSAQIKVGTASGEIGISLGGTIDRIDRDGEGYRILDYKTGQADSIFGSVGDLFNPENKNRNSSVFQILLYAWICDQQFIGKEAIFPGLYSTRKIFEEDFSPVIRLKDTAEKFDFRKFRESYADNLRALIGQIFDTGTSFSQTTNPDHCMKCDFAEICHRKSRQRS
jgi:CRISPR/Cas system-associated exonuclease Cas4 (RecB family)